MGKKIGFVCTTIFHYVHFNRIAACFGDRAIFVVSTPKFTHRHEKMTAYFKENNIPYCDEEELVSGRVRAEAIVAPYFLPLLNFVDPRIKRIRVLYGYAKDAWNYADWNEGFDLILAYGPYSFERLCKMAPTVSIGHPRYLGNHGARNAEVVGTDGRALTEWLARSQRKTILYCPTWGGLSSFQWFREALDSLLADYRIIVKLHHGISLSKKFSPHELAGEHVFLCDETVDLFDLFPVSDLVVSDYSGAIFDAILAGKRLLLVNSIPPDVKDTGMYNLKSLRNIGQLNPAAIGDDESLDIYIRKWVPTVNEPGEIASAAARLLDGPVMAYDDLNEKLYAFRDDRAPERAYAAIAELLARNEEPRKTHYPGRFLMDEFVSFVERFKEHPFLVWGVGHYGQLVIPWLKHGGYRIKAILDKNADKLGKAFCGLPIASPDTVRLEPDDKLIVSFIPGSLEEAASLMQNMGVKDEAWFLPFQV